jgi:hypothetical protein
LGTGVVSFSLSPFLSSCPFFIISIFVLFKQDKKTAKYGKYKKLIKPTDKKMLQEVEIVFRTELEEFGYTVFVPKEDSIDEDYRLFVSFSFPLCIPLPFPFPFPFLFLSFNFTTTFRFYFSSFFLSSEGPSSRHSSHERKK